MLGPVILYPLVYPILWSDLCLLHDDSAAVAGCDVDISGIDINTPWFNRTTALITHSCSEPYKNYHCQLEYISDMWRQNVA
jgi:hypothetical protein